jgi:nucleotide-binding universal stress UspA family protein
MSLQHILADIGGLPTDDLVLELAWQIAAPDHAHVSVIHLWRDRAQQDEDLADDGYAAELAARQNRATAAFHNFLSRRSVTRQEEPGPSPSVTASWRMERTSSPASLTHLARVADLTVMMRPASTEIDLSDDTETVLLGAGRPVLLAPATQALHPLRDILIAWDGSLEATRAVGTALPLLRHAQRVHLFMRPSMRLARGTSGDGDADALIAYLARHAVTVERVASAKPDLSVGEDLLATSHQADASLLVMGAYSHGRMREEVFGGATQHVLTYAALPVLMAP